MVSAVEASLKQQIRGEVRFDRGSRALYSMDGSNYRQIPLGVVIPEDMSDAIEGLRGVGTLDFNAEVSFEFEHLNLYVFSVAIET